MGYRSDVAYTITLRNKQVLNELIALVMVKGDYISKALSQCQIEVGVAGGELCRINFFAEAWKWYEGDFPEVDGHHELMDFAVNNFSDDAAYRFVRIGEEMDDNDLRDAYSDEAMDLIDWDLNISRSIDAPFNTNYIPVGDKLAVIS